MLNHSRIRTAVLALAGALVPALVPAPSFAVPPAPAAASAPTGNAPLHDTRWVLQTIDGAAITHTGARSVPHLTLHRSSQHLSGFAGCNRLGGRYTQSGPQLALTAVARTRMQCASALMQQEQRLLAALAQVDGYRIEGRVLSLLQGNVVKVTLSIAAAS